MFDPECGQYEVTTRRVQATMRNVPAGESESGLVHTKGPKSYEYIGANGRIWTVAVCGICGHKTRRPKPTAGDKHVEA